MTLGYLIRGGAADPDHEFGIIKVLGVFTLFVAMAGGWIGWGSVLSRRLRLKGLGPSLVFGHVVASLIGFCAIHAFGVSYSSRPLFWVLIVCGWMLLPTFRQASPWLHWTWAETFAWGAVFWIALMRLLMASLGHGTTDPFIYHLYLPRVWVDRGDAFASLAVPHTMQGSYWEYLFIWSQSMLGGSEGRGLIEGHLFGQWSHFLFGFLACFFSLVDLAKHLGVKGWWVPALALAGVGSREMMPYAWLAKSDWGVFSVFLLGVHSVLQNIERPWLGLCLLGYAFAAKFTLYSNVIPFLLIWFILLVRRRGISRSLGFAATGALVFLLPVLPIFIRNWIFVENPVFPLFNHWFESPLLSETWTRDLSVQHGQWAWDPTVWLPRLWDVLSDHPLGVFFFGGLFMSGRVAPLAWSTISTVLIYSMTVFLFGFLRWAGPALVLVPFLGSLVVYQAWVWLNTKKPVVRELEWFAISLVLVGSIVQASSRLDLRFIGEALFGGQTTDQVIRSPKVHTGGDAKAWLRRHATPESLKGSSIISSGDNQLYYVSHLPIVVGRDHPQIDAVVNRTERNVDLIRVLRKFNAKYLLDSEHFAGGPWGVLPDRLQSVYRLYPETIVFQGMASVVVDLELLEGLIFKQSFEREKDFKFWITWQN